MSLSFPTTLHTLFRFQEDDCGLVPGMRWRVYSGTLDGSTRHCRIFYDDGNKKEEIEHVYTLVGSWWIFETQAFLGEVARFSLGKHTLFSSAVRACVTEDPWLSYADSYPIVEPVD